MTPEARHRAPFELRRFTAAPVSADLAVVELEGRFAAARGRFARQPVLVVEEPGAPRAELAPVRARRDGERWRSSFAVPLGALRRRDASRSASRGVLLDLPGARRGRRRRPSRRRRARGQRAAPPRRGAGGRARRGRRRRRAGAGRARGRGRRPRARRSPPRRRERIADLEAEVVGRRIATRRGRRRERARGGRRERQRTAVGGRRGSAGRRARARPRWPRRGAAAAEERERHEAARRPTCCAPSWPRSASARRPRSPSCRRASRGRRGGRRRRRPATPAERAPAGRSRPSPTRRGDGRRPRRPWPLGPARSPPTATSTTTTRAPIPLRQAPPLRPPRSEAPPEPVHHHGPALSPWVAVVALVRLRVPRRRAAVLGLLSCSVSARPPGRRSGSRRSSTPRRTASARSPGRGCRRRPRARSR